ncbi:TRAP transporter permease [Rickettsiales bacterium]|nr:TRAP transporter permease [Rickettsiales bacterium]
MSANVKNGKAASAEELEDLVIESDSGARKPGGNVGKLLLFSALFWSIFQIWVSSPLPYTSIASFLHIPIFNSTESRFIHLAFALFIAFLAYPATKNSPRDYVPLQDWLFALIGTACVLYLYFFRDDLAVRTGLPNNFDILISAVGILLLLEAARRALGPPLVIIASIFLFYTFAGSMSFMPDVIAHKGQSVAKVASHQWLTTEGVFGIAIGVSTDFVFLFVLFGALLERAGAGNYFIKLAFSMLGHFRGGPAKAAVLSSAMTGLISGSSIANVVTTGTFTIPLMRRVGFSREKAGAVEVASSVNGQIMPPVMGAAAFLMVEYVGISYVEVVKAAFIPAVISYIALLYLVHLEALKADMRAIPKSVNGTLVQSLISVGLTVSSIIILAGVVYFGVGWVKDLFPKYASYILALLVTLVYVLLLWYASKVPDLEMDDPNARIVKLPETGPTAKTGFHYILPIVVLVWCLMVERLSPGLSAFWATIFMAFIVITQKPIKMLFRKAGNIKEGFVDGSYDLLDGLVTGARNMVGIGIATAAAGIIVGSVSLTGVGQVMTELVEIISGGSFVLVLIFTAMICLVLGMGLPTTANYIVVASLMASVIRDLAAQNGMDIPLIAIHLFVFYFGIMADVTPPVGLASFAAAAVSGGDPIRTGVQAFLYSIRTVILPFIFIYNTELLLYGVDSWIVGMWVFIKATVAILIFAAATQGWLIIRSKLHESLILLVVAFALFRPGFFVDLFTPPYVTVGATETEKVVGKMKEGEVLKLSVLGENRYGDPKSFVVHMPITKGGSGSERLERFGIVLSKESGKMVVSDVLFNSEAEKSGLDFDFVITSIDVPQPQFDKNWIYVIALIGFFGVVIAQRSRKSMFVSVQQAA